MKTEVEMSEKKGVLSLTKAPEEPKPEASSVEIIKSIVLYSLCSSTLLLLNKLVIAHIPLHSYVSCAQFAFATLAVFFLATFGLIDPIDFVDFDKFKAYFLYVCCFIVSLYSNFRALENGKIETVIVFRACTPIAVSLLDYAFLGRELPSKRSWFSLLVIIVGATGYVASDKAFSSSGWSAYTWVLIWFCALCVTMTGGKMVLKNVKPSSTWDSVYYNNLIGLLPMMLFGSTVAGEWETYQKIDLGEERTPIMSLLLLSCIVGTGIAYAGWRCRSLISPASYTLVGVVNKLFTIVLSMVITGDGASWQGLACLIFSICGSAFYKQAPMRVTKDTPPTQEIEPLKNAPNGYTNKG